MTHPSLLLPGAESWIGRTTSYSPYDVTAVDIAKFALSIGATDPVHFDKTAAQEAGYEAIVAPLGYYTVIRHASANLVPLDELTEDGAAPDMVPPTTAQRRMAGTTSTKFLRPVEEGDRISLTKTVTTITEKVGRSGPLVFVGYDLVFTDSLAKPVVTEKFVRILR